ncbi:hypothetical protein ACOSQ2_025126 [Xanthoceras sorbifolium]
MGHLSTAGVLHPSESERSDQCHGKFPGETQARDNSPPLANADALIDYASFYFLSCCMRNSMTIWGLVELPTFPDPSLSISPLFLSR